jgi:hypothetical protein
VRRRCLIVVPRPLPAAPLAVRRTYLAVLLSGAGACFSRQTHVLAVAAPPAPAAQSASPGEGHSADEQRSGVVGRSFGHTYVIAPHQEKRCAEEQSRWT